MPEDEIRQRVTGVAEKLRISHKLDNRATRLSGGEMQRGEFHAVAVSNFLGPKAAVQKPLAKFIKRILNAGRFHDIDARAEDIRAFDLHRELDFINASISPMACRNPTNTARAMME